jgi:hypothetical protein
VLPSTCLFGDLRREQAALRIRSGYSPWIFGIDPISSSRLLYRRKPILRRNHELLTMLITTSWTDTTLILRWNHELPMILTTICIRTKHDEEIMISFTTTTLLEGARYSDGTMSFQWYRVTTFMDIYRPIFGWNRELPMISICICYWTKRSKDITHMSIGSYSVSSSLWTDKMLVQQQPMDGYDVYSQMGPRVSNGCRIRNSNKRGMPEYRKTLWGTTTKGARLSGFRHCHESTGWNVV